MKKILVFLLMVGPGLVLASGGDVKLEHAQIDARDLESLKRGADMFYSQCVGCHSTKYVRYERIAKDLNLSEAYVKENYMYNTEVIGSTALSSMPADLAKKWFGTPPPDMSLEARLNGNDWLYSYLIGFYEDDSRPFGYNNHVFKDVGMPNVLAGLKADLGEEKFKAAVNDLTNYMAYMADPVKVEREELGTKVIIFLLILLIPAYLLKVEYWKDVH
ncbi:MAG: cytochrome c1 [Gammaproteobacteria bacterium]|nr:cytochrome c1 [Gammaproteobacteria bacterium]